MKIGEYKQAMSHMLRKDDSLENFSFNPEAKLINNDPIGYKQQYAEGGIVKASQLSELLKKSGIEVTPTNIGRFTKQYGIKKDPNRPEASSFYLEPSKEELKKIKASYDNNLLKASGSTEAGREAFKIREARARELLTQGYNQTEANKILIEEFPQFKNMKSSLSNIAQDLKDQGIKVVSGRESEIKTPISKYSKERRELQKSVSDPYIEKVIADSKREAGFGDIDLAHRTSMKQNDRFGTEILSSNLGLDTQDINRKLIKPIENKLEPIYKQQKNIVNKINREGSSVELRKQLESLNKQVSDIVASTDGRLQGILIDEYNLKPKTVGIDYANVFGAGVLPDKPVSELTKEEIALGIKQIPGQQKAISKEFVLKQFNDNLLKDLSEDQQAQIVSAVGCPTKLSYSDGGRVKFSKGGDCYTQGLKKLEEGNLGTKEINAIEQISKDVGIVSKNIDESIAFAKTLTQGGKNLLKGVGSYLNEIVPGLVGADFVEGLTQGKTTLESVRDALIPEGVGHSYDIQQRLTPKEKEAQQRLGYKELPDILKEGEYGIGDIGAEQEKYTPLKDLVDQYSIAVGENRAEEELKKEREERIKDFNKEAYYGTPLMDSEVFSEQLKKDND
jgi:hypothetical protein